MGKNEKKPKSKKAKIVILSIVAVITALLLSAFFIIVLPFIIMSNKTDFLTEDTGANLINVEMTEQQRLKDFDYMYDIVCLENPEKERIEQAYGISYDDIYNRYRDLVVYAETDYEYFSYLGAFLAVLPGCHNIMGLPDYEINAVHAEYMLNEIYGTQEFKDYTYSWKESFRDDVEDRLGYNLVGFTYVNGSYVVTATDNILPKYNEDYIGAALVSIDGRDPKDICFDVYDCYTPKYDGINDCFFRSYLIYNDGIGEKHTGELLLRDGTTLTIDLYDDPGFDYAALLSRKVYPEFFADQEAAADTSSGSDTTVTDVMSPDYIPSTYRISTDPGKKLVYVNSVSCNTYEGERLAVELTNALEEADADTIILDIRANGGGSIDFVTKQLLPVIFSHDVTFESHVYGGKNSHTRKFYGSAIYRFLETTFDNLSDFSTTGKNYAYTETFTVQGKAAKDYKIYLLTSYNTFSAADVMTRICKEYDNCVVVGTNTSGEGICGSIMQCYLPESHLMFAYAPTVNINYPEDSYYGTEPDIYIPYTLDEYNARQDLFYSGTNPNSYEVRQQWDQTLLRVIDMTEED